MAFTKGVRTLSSCDEIYGLIKELNEQGIKPTANDLFYRTKHAPYFISHIVRILEAKGLVKRVKVGRRFILEVVGDGRDKS